MKISLKTRLSVRLILSITACLAFFLAGWVAREQYASRVASDEFERWRSVMDDNVQITDSVRQVPYRLGEVLKASEREVIVNLGFDDGVRIGDVLAVYRSDLMICLLDVVATAPNTSTCPNAGVTIVAGDRVELNPARAEPSDDTERRWTPFSR